MAKVKNIVVEHAGIQYRNRSASANKAIANYRHAVVKQAIQSMNAAGMSSAHIKQAVNQYWASC